MCCFTRPVNFVSNTRIFARFEDSPSANAAPRQFVAYAMSLGADEDLAMVLPVPVVPGSGDKAMTFIDLSAYPKFFNEMNSGFPVPRSTVSRGSSKSVEAIAPPLEVHSVGSFDASFVPTVADFHRLDKRFRFSDETWKKLPGYASYGFAVFKLKATHGAVHPMAFSFPSALPKQLFFPTVHIHDGEVHAKADFDHVLYAQGHGINAKGWSESPGIASQFMKPKLTNGLVSADHHIYRRSMVGMLANGDILLQARNLATA